LGRTTILAWCPTTGVDDCRSLALVVVIVSVVTVGAELVTLTGKSSAWLPKLLTITLLVGTIEAA
jgi:hypothetical protein